jgi:hypothetical protein
MSGNAKLIPSQEAAEAVEFGPVDLADVPKLIRDEKDPEATERALAGFTAASYSYIDELEDKAISRLVSQDLSKPALEGLESAMGAVRPLFDELADAFFEPYQDAHPALADRGYHLLFDLMRAAVIIERYAESEADRFDAAKKEMAAAAKRDAGPSKSRAQRKGKSDALYEVVKAIVSRESRKVPVSVGYAERIAPEVRIRLKRLGYKTDKGTSIPTIKSNLIALAGQKRQGQV